MALGVNQVGGNTATSAAGATITTGSLTTISGSLIVVILHSFGATGASAGGDVTDSKSNTYTYHGESAGGGGLPGIAIYSNDAGTRGASHTFSGNRVNDTASNLNIAVCEITYAGSISFDAGTFAAATDGTSAFTVTAAAAISGNVIAIYGVTTDASVGGAWTQPTGYTNIINETNAVNLVSCASYKLSETGTPSPAASNPGTFAAGRELFATFQEAGAGLDVPTLHVPFQQTVWRM